MATPGLYKQNCFSCALMIDGCNATHARNQVTKNNYIGSCVAGMAHHITRRIKQILFLWHVQEMEECPSKVTVASSNMPIPRDSFKSPNLASRLTPRSSFILPAGMADSVGGKKHVRVG